MQTAVRWAGSKKALLPWLRKYCVGSFDRYIEPFCGSACLFFDLEPDSAILGDVNGELIDTYLALKNDTQQVIERLNQYSPSKKSYYSARSVNPNSLKRIEVAARFLFLNRLCFNGIYRTNLQGEFNVPYAKPKSKVRIDIEALKKMGMALQHAQLINADFEVIIQNAGKGDLVYLDPPYAMSQRRTFSEYHPDTFTPSDVERLRILLRLLDKKGAQFIVSYGDSREGRLLVSEWKSRRVRTRRNVAGFAAHRRAAYELIATNMELKS